MEIEIESSKIEEVQKYLKLFLKQKLFQEEEIRSFDVDEVDLYKDLLLEEYLSGVIIVLRACNIDFSIDDRLSDLEIFNTKQNVKCSPEERIKEIYMKHRTEAINLLNKISVCTNTNELMEMEKILHGIFYSFLGSTTILNKFGLRASISNFYNGSPHFLSYVDGREITDYLEVSKQLNGILDYMYDKYNILKILSVTQWRKNISFNQNKMLQAMNEIKKVSKVNDEISVNGDERSEQLIKTFNEIDDKLVDLSEELIIKEAKHQSSLFEFARTYFRYENKK